GALDGELGALAGVGGRLAHDPREALHVALERHHARAHEPVLQLGDGARLLLQQGLGFFREALQQLLDARNVVGRLGEGPRVLLDGGVTIELEGIELAAVLRAFVIVLVQDLRLGLDLETAQLLLEARHRARQLAQVEIERAELLLEAGARNARFARDVEELIEEAGIAAGPTWTGLPCGWAICTSSAFSLRSMVSGSPKESDRADPAAAGAAGAAAATAPRSGAESGGGAGGGSAGVAPSERERSWRLAIMARGGATGRPWTTCSRMRASSSRLAWIRSNTAGSAPIVPLSTAITSVSSSWLKSPMGVIPAMRAPPF